MEEAYFASPQLTSVRLPACRSDAILSILSGMRTKVVVALVAALSFKSVGYVHANEEAAHLDDEFMRQSAGQVALAIQAQQCDLRDLVWLRKLITVVIQRLSDHMKEARPNRTDGENKSAAQGFIYGAIYGAEGDIGAPAVDPNDIMKSGEQSLAKSLACQVIEYRKSELLYLDGIINGGGS